MALNVRLDIDRIEHDQRQECRGGMEFQGEVKEVVGVSRLHTVRPHQRLHGIAV